MLFVAILIFVLFIWFIIVYNGFVSKSNSIKNSSAGIDVQLKKRYDLIPNLVSTIKGYAKHEQEVLTKVTALRNQAQNFAGPIGQQMAIDSQLTTALQGMMMIAEAYPDLKASDQFLNLQHNLTEIESQISAARRALNAAVLDYNNSVQMFPTSLIASIFKYKSFDFFEIDKDQKDVTKVEL